MTTVANLETLNSCPSCGADNIPSIDALSRICECKTCGCIFDNPRPTIEDLIAFYSRSDKYDAWVSEEVARDLLWSRRLKQLLRVGKLGSLLDVGAGIGQFLHHARPYFSAVCGTEVSKSAVEIAREKYGLDLRRGEIQSIDFGSEQFDNITLFHVLEHVPNPKSVIEKCSHLLRKNGVLVIAVPNDISSARAKTKRLLRSLGVSRFRNVGKLGLPKLVLDGSLPEIHLSHFTPAALRRLVEQAGLSVTRDTLDPHYALIGLRKLKHDTYYVGCHFIKLLFGVNLYDTVLLVAEKRWA